MTPFLAPITTALKNVNHLCEAGTRDSIIASAIAAIGLIGVVLSIATSNIFIAIPFCTPFLLLQYHELKNNIPSLVRVLKAHYQACKQSDELEDLLKHPEKNPARALQQACYQSRHHTTTSLLNNPLITDQMFLNQLVLETHQNRNITTLLSSDRIKNVPTTVLFNAQEMVMTRQPQHDIRTCYRSTIELISRKDLNDADRRRVLNFIVSPRFSRDSNIAHMNWILKSAQELSRTRAWDRRCHLLALARQNGRFDYSHPINQE